MFQRGVFACVCFWIFVCTYINHSVSVSHVSVPFTSLWTHMLSQALFLTHTCPRLDIELKLGAPNDIRKLVGEHSSAMVSCAFCF